MKIAVISDVHLGARRFRKAQNGVNLIEQKGYEQFQKCTDGIIDKKPDLLLIPGDFFDQHNPTTLSLDHANREFKKIADNSIPTLIVAGNHEYGGTEHSYGLHCYDNLKSYDKQKHVKYDVETMVFYKNEEAIIIVALPHQKILDYSKVDRGLNKIWADSIKSVKAYRNALKKGNTEDLNTLDGSDDLNGVTLEADKITTLLVSHGVSDATSFLSFADEKSAAINNMLIPDAMIKEFDNAIFGHIHHSYKEVLESKALDNKTIILSPGSIQHDYPEVFKEGSISRTFDKGAGPIYFNPYTRSISRQRFNTVKKYELEIDSYDKLKAIMDNAGQDIYLIKYSGENYTHEDYQTWYNQTAMLVISNEKVYTESEKITPVDDFWTWVGDNHPDYVEDFTKIKESLVSA